MEDGEIVEINYIGRIQRTGEIFDLTDEQVAEEEGFDASNMSLGPVKIMLGEGYVLEGLDDEIRQMEVGDEKTIAIPKEKAFGSRKGSEIQTISEREFKKHDVRPVRGMQVEIDGQRGKILTVSNGRVKVDFNHPLAGQDLEYDVELIRKVEDTEEQIEAVIDFHLNLDYTIDVEDGDIEVELGEEIPQPVMDKLEQEIEKLKNVNNATLRVEENEQPSD